jgi:hypothetical protein
MYTLKTWRESGREKLFDMGFPWLLFSVMFTANLAFVKNYKSTLPGNFLSLILCMRFVIVGFNIFSGEGMERFLRFETISVDVSDSMQCR